MQTIYLDISNKGVVPTIYAKQGDVGRKFEVVFTDSGIPYSIPTNAKISVWYEGDSGVGNYTDIGENSAIAIGENKAVVELITQMLSEDGEGIVCLVMNAGNNQIGSWNIRYLCERVPGFDSEGAKEYYTAFSKTVESLKQATENLTPEAIGAAPAGYGLGGDCQTIDSWDNAVKAGFYKSNGNTPEGFWWWGYVVPHDEKNVAQTIFRDGDNGNIVSCVRKSSDGIWQPWEFVNPPMLPGAEYRTTKRLNGSPVYTAAVTGTSLEGENYAELPVHISDGNLVSVMGQVGDYPVPTTMGGNLVFYHNWCHFSVGFKCDSHFAGLPFRFVVEYTK